MIFTGKYLVLDNVNVKYVLVLVAGDELPRVFIKGDKSQIGKIFFLKHHDRKAVHSFLEEEMSESEFYNSGIARSKGQVFSEVEDLEADLPIVSLRSQLTLA